MLCWKKRNFSLPAKLYILYILLIFLCVAYADPSGEKSSNDNKSSEEQNQRALGPSRKGKGRKGSSSKHSGLGGLFGNKLQRRPSSIGLSIGADADDGGALGLNMGSAKSVGNSAMSITVSRSGVNSQDSGSPNMNLGKQQTSSGSYSFSMSGGNDGDSLGFLNGGSAKSAGGGSMSIIFDGNAAASHDGGSRDINLSDLQSGAASSSGAYSFNIAGDGGDSYGQNMGSVMSAGDGSMSIIFDGNAAASHDGGSRDINLSDLQSGAASSSGAYSFNIAGDGGDSYGHHVGSVMSAGDGSMTISPDGNGGDSYNTGSLALNVDDLQSGMARTSGAYSLSMSGGDMSDINMDSAQSTGDGSMTISQDGNEGDSYNTGSLDLNLDDLQSGMARSSGAYSLSISGGDTSSFNMGSAKSAEDGSLFITADGNEDSSLDSDSLAFNLGQRPSSMGSSGTYSSNIDDGSAAGDWLDFNIAPTESGGSGSLDIDRSISKSYGGGSFDTHWEVSQPETIPSSKSYSFTIDDGSQLDPDMDSKESVDGSLTFAAEGNPRDSYGQSSFDLNLKDSQPEQVSGSKSYSFTIEGGGDGRKMDINMDLAQSTGDKTLTMVNDGNMAGSLDPNYEAYLSGDSSSKYSYGLTGSDDTMLDLNQDSGAQGNGGIMTIDLGGLTGNTRQGGRLDHNLDGMSNTGSSSFTFDITGERDSSNLDRNFERSKGGQIGSSGDEGGANLELTNKDAVGGKGQFNFAFGGSMTESEGGLGPNLDGQLMSSGSSLNTDISAERDSSVTEGFLDSNLEGGRPNGFIIGLEGRGTSEGQGVNYGEKSMGSGSINIDISQNTPSFGSGGTLDLNLEGKRSRSKGLKIGLVGGSSSDEGGLGLGGNHKVGSGSISITGQGESSGGRGNLDLNLEGKSSRSKGLKSGLGGGTSSEGGGRGAGIILDGKSKGSSSFVIDISGKKNGDTGGSKKKKTGGSSFSLL